VWNNEPSQQPWSETPLDPGLGGADCYIEWLEMAKAVLYTLLLT
jgi:hypothetical protein